MPVLVLENIRSAYNVGNCIRTADALGYEVVLSGYSPHPEQDNVAKTSLGAEEHVALRQFWNPKEAVEQLQDAGYVLIAAEKDDQSVSLTTFTQPEEQQFALILGNEKEGVLPDTLDAADYLVHIPMQGYKDSLNVAQAGAICMRTLSGLF